MKFRPGRAGLVYADREAGGRADMKMVIGPFRDSSERA